MQLAPPTEADCKEPLALPNLRIELGIVEGCSMEDEHARLGARPPTWARCGNEVGL